MKRRCLGAGTAVALLLFTAEGRAGWVIDIATTNITEGPQEQTLGRYYLEGRSFRRDTFSADPLPHVPKPGGFKPDVVRTVRFDGKQLIQCELMDPGRQCHRVEVDMFDFTDGALDGYRRIHGHPTALGTSRKIEPVTCADWRIQQLGIVGETGAHEETEIRQCLSTAIELKAVTESLKAYGKASGELAAGMQQWLDFYGKHGFPVWSHRRHARGELSQSMVKLTKRTVPSAEFGVPDGFRVADSPGRAAKAAVAPKPPDFSKVPPDVRRRAEEAFRKRK